MRSGEGKTVMNIEDYDIESKLDEADSEAEKTDERLTHNDVFAEARKAI